ncbi:hypothetical protein DL93DRAFT_2074796 [Clavulina sp. PMI_390]|nr:hypothetical protein DL93DRAFT_2074796 [Clavulina sp. PMI_390]
MSSPIAGPSTAQAYEPESPRQEAGPLPRKIAEFGYVSPITEPASRFSSDPSASSADLTLRPHPAENTGAGAERSSDESSRTSHPAGAASTTSLPTVNSVDSRTKRSKVLHGALNLLRGRSPAASDPMPRYWGVTLPTILRLIFTFLMIVGVIVSWVLTIKIVSSNQNKSSSSNNSTSSTPTSSSDAPDQSDPSSTNSSNTTVYGMGQGLIFIHTGFTVVVLLMLLLLERAWYIARAERIAFLYPDAANPRNIPFAPWSRPPLPTYANAVGFRGTGDVEDREIAGPPPPEYGNTRGSTLLLSSFFGTGGAAGAAAPGSRRGSVQAAVDGGVQASLARLEGTHLPSHANYNNVRRSWADDPRGRPVSYISRISAVPSMSQVPSSPPATPAMARIAGGPRAASRMSNVSFQDNARRSMILLGRLEHGGALPASPNPQTK